MTARNYIINSIRQRISIQNVCKIGYFSFTLLFFSTNSLSMCNWERGKIRRGPYLASSNSVFIPFIFSPRTRLRVCDNFLRTMATKA